MRADDLTKAQCGALRNKVSGIVAYLYGLNRRMGERRFPEDDPLQQAVAKAQTAIGELHVELVCRANDGAGWHAPEKKPAKVDLRFTRTSKPRKHERRDRD